MSALRTNVGQARRRIAVPEVKDLLLGHLQAAGRTTVSGRSSSGSQAPAATTTRSAAIEGVVGLDDRARAVEPHGPGPAAGDQLGAATAARR